MILLREGQTPILKAVTSLISLKVGWKAISLSFAVRYQFIKFSIYSLVAYQTHALFLSKTCFKFTNKLSSSKFLYHANISSQKIHFISCELGQKKKKSERLSSFPSNSIALNMPLAFLGKKKLIIEYASQLKTKLALGTPLD